MSFQAEIFSTGDVLRETLKLIKPEDQVWLTKVFSSFFRAFNDMALPRKPLSDGNVSVEYYARALADFIPGESDAELERRIKHHQDTRAMIALADSHHFQMRRESHEKNIMYGANLYYDAGMLGNSEARTAMAIQNFCILNSHLGPGEYKLNAPIPAHKRNCTEHLDMWGWLNEAAEDGYVSSFLLCQAMNAQKLGDYQLSPTVKQILLDNEAKNKAELIERHRAHAHRCSVPSCVVKIADANKLKQCGKCRVAKYCSRECQVAHWPLHKQECKLLASPTPAVPPVPSVTASVASPINGCQTAKVQEHENPNEEGVTSDTPTSVFMQVQTPHGPISIMSNSLSPNTMKETNNLHVSALRSGEDKVDECLRQVRMQSLSKLRSTESFAGEGEELMFACNYKDAARAFTYALDKLPSTFGRLKSEREILLGLLSKRATCHVKAAETHKSTTMAEDALDDCHLVLVSGAFDLKQLLQENPEVLAQFKTLEETANKLLDDFNITAAIDRVNLAVLSRRQTTAPAVTNSIQQADSAVASQRSLTRRQRGRLEQQRTLVRQSLFDDITPVVVAVPPLDTVNVMLCDSLVSSQIAMNATSSADSCPVCMNSWESFSEHSFVAVATCRHATCLPCLAKFCRSADMPFERATQQGVLHVSFCCTICREPFPKNTVQDAADEIVSLQLVPTLTTLIAQLGLQEIESKRLVSVLLQRNDFDVQLVENALFQFVGTLHRSQSVPLSTEDKQQIFTIAHAPVNALNAERLEVKRRFDSLFDTTSSEYKELRERLETLTQQLSQARVNATKEIFTQVNNNIDGSLGTNNAGVSSVFVDLHGLHKEGARQMLDEHVLPVLSVFEHIVIVTGKGLHSAASTGREMYQLRDYVKDYLTNQCGLKCEIVKGNDGMLRVYAGCK